VNASLVNYVKKDTFLTDLGNCQKQTCGNQMMLPLESKTL